MGFFQQETHFLKKRTPILGLFRLLEKTRRFLKILLNLGKVTRHASIVPHTSLCLGYLRRMDDRQLFVEALEEQIRDWGKAAKVCEQEVFSVELAPDARHSAQKEAKKYRGHIAELRRLIEFLKRA